MKNKTELENNSRKKKKGRSKKRLKELDKNNSQNNKRRRKDRDKSSYESSKKKKCLGNSKKNLSAKKLRSWKEKDWRMKLKDYDLLILRRNRKSD